MFSNGVKNVLWEDGFGGEGVAVLRLHVNPCPEDGNIVTFWRTGKGSPGYLIEE